MTDLRDWTTCPKCAAELTRGPLDDGVVRLHCTACDLIIYDNPAPTACALITRGGRLMLTRRGIEPARDKWDLPGGYVEVDEHPEETLRRELLEETRLEIAVTGMLGIFLDTYGDGGTDTLNICYEARITSGSETPGSDVTEIGWFAPGEIPANLAFRNTVEAIEVWRAKSSLS